MRTNEWVKARRCGTTSCVEVQQNPAGGARVRDSALVDEAGVNTSPVLSFGGDEWTAFLRWAPTAN